MLCALSECTFWARLHATDGCDWNGTSCTTDSDCNQLNLNSTKYKFPNAPEGLSCPIDSAKYPTPWIRDACACSEGEQGPNYPTSVTTPWCPAAAKQSCLEWINNPAWGAGSSPSHEQHACWSTVTGSECQQTCCEVVGLAPPPTPPENPPFPNDSPSEAFVKGYNYFVWLWGQVGLQQVRATPVLRCVHTLACS